MDDDLIETDFGDWEGLTFGEAAERDPELHRRWLGDTSVAPPGGESFDTVTHRIRQARNRIIAEHGATTVLVVSHVTPIKTVLRQALDAAARDEYGHDAPSLLVILMTRVHVAGQPRKRRGGRVDGGNWPG